MIALERITDNQYSSFSDYKKARFKEVEQKLDRLDKEINVKEYVQRFYEALKLDAADITDGVEKLLKQKPNCLNEYWCPRTDLANLIGYKYSNQIRQEIYYKLKNKTDDFKSDIYMNEKQQDVSDLTVKDQE